MNVCGGCSSVEWMVDLELDWVILKVVLMLDFEELMVLLVIYLKEVGCFDFD